MLALHSNHIVLNISYTPTYIHLFHQAVVSSPSQNHSITWLTKLTSTNPLNPLSLLLGLGSYPKQLSV